MTETHRGASEPAVDVAVAEVIERSADVVSSYANDPSHAPDWYTKISSVEWKSPPPLRVGSEVAFVARFLGREMRYTYAIVECTARSLVMRTAEGPFPMETRYHYESMSDGSTRITLRNVGDPKGFSRLFAPFIQSAMRRAMKKDLQKLKHVLEHDESNS